MKCPNCEQEMGHGERCPGCGIDIVVFERTGKASDSLYNKGLRQARLGDLSGARDSLHKSIEFNKANTNARNLLGLVYFEIGEVGDALKHWVISSSQKKEKNLAAEYISSMQNNQRKLERYNDSIKMFNQALNYIKQKSEDMAVIQLKKAIELNPKFVQAMNLLAFCYLIQKERDKARAVLDKALALDMNNPIALSYMNELGAARVRAETASRLPRVAQQTAAPVQAYNPPTYTRLSARDKKSFGDSFPMAEILFFIIGGACVLALFWFLLMPQATEQRDATIERLKNEISATATETEKSKAELQAKIEELEEKNAKLVQENKVIAEQVTIQEKVTRVAEIVNVFNSGDIEQAAEQIYSFDVSGLPAETLNTLLTTKGVAYEKAASNLYNQGAKDYNAGRYADAKLAFGKALKFVDPEANYTDDIIYLLAVIAEREDEKEEAIRHYQSIVSNYTESNRFSQAQSGLRRLAGP